MRRYYSASTGGFYAAGVHDAMPADAVEITAEDHARLLTQQGHGQRIVANEDGRPIAVDPLPLPMDEVAQHVRKRRDALLAASDKTVLPDYPHDPAAQAAWRRYRQVLRELPKQKGFPMTIRWPRAPGPL